MKESKCRYCGKQFSNNMQVGGHETFCYKNPSYQRNKQKVKSTRITSNPTNVYQLICNKCGKTYQLQLTVKTYQSGKYSKHCSRACANSRTWTEQDKLKKSISSRSSKKVEIAKQNQRMPKKVVCCIVCGISFQTKSWENKKYCSKECSSNRVYSKQFRQNQSHNTKLAYQQGRKIVSGGTTKWVQVITDNGVIKVQGTYQQRMCNVLSKMKRLGLILSWQYTPDRFKYIAQDGNMHVYTPDFKIINSDGSIKYIETKGYSKIRDNYKWNALKQLDIQLEVCYNRNITQYELYVEQFDIA